MYLRKIQKRLKSRTLELARETRFHDEMISIIIGNSKYGQDSACKLMAKKLALAINDMRSAALVLAVKHKKGNREMDVPIQSVLFTYIGLSQAFCRLAAMINELNIHGENIAISDYDYLHQLSNNYSLSDFTAYNELTESFGIKTIMENTIYFDFDQKKVIYTDKPSVRKG